MHFSLQKCCFNFFITFPWCHTHNTIFALTVAILATHFTSFLVLMFNKFLHLLEFHACLFHLYLHQLREHTHAFMFLGCHWADPGCLGPNLVSPSMLRTFLAIKALPCLQKLCRGCPHCLLVLLYAILGGSAQYCPLELHNAQFQRITRPDYYAHYAVSVSSQPPQTVHYIDPTSMQAHWQLGVCNVQFHLIVSQLPEVNATHSCLVITSLFPECFLNLFDVFSRHCLTMSVFSVSRYHMFLSISSIVQVSWPLREMDQKAQLKEALGTWLNMGQ